MVSKFEQAMFDHGDKLSAFLYDLSGWHLRVISLWAYTALSGPVISLLVAGDQIDSPGEWITVAFRVLFGLTAIWWIGQKSIPVVNTFAVVLRFSSMLAFVRWVSIAFTLYFLVYVVFQPNRENIGYLLSELVFIATQYLTMTVIPERPRRKRRLMPRLKLSEDPLPQGAA